MALRNKKRKKEIGVKQSIITSTNPKSDISEQYRTIRTSIQFSFVDKEIKTIAITSPSPGEGKSTTSANLAISFAQQGKKILLVDSDLRKPTAHKAFGLQNVMGLTNVLTKQTQLASAIQETFEKNLYVLPSGPLPPNPAELLGSNAMASFIEEAEVQFDIIFFDTPPLIAVTDGQILANLCEGTILVVSSGRTERDQAIQAKERLLAANSHIIGVVLNNKKMSKATYY